MLRNFMYKLHTHCRACGYAKPGASGTKSNSDEKLVKVFDLGIQPLANDFCREKDHRAGYAPLEVVICPNCTLAQLSIVVDPEILYRRYPYVTSPSQMMQDHFSALIDDIKDETGGKSVLEIGSNDGRLLSVMQKDGYSVLGVEPAENLSDFARANGIPTQTGFFGDALAKILPSCDIIIARHVFCHIDDWQDFVRGLETVAHKDTLICIEVPYVGDTLKHCEFDQIYHEHLSYLSIRAMRALLKESPLQLYRVLRYPIHGGVILVMLRHRESGHLPSKDALLDSEELAGVPEWKEFQAKAHQHIQQLREKVRCLRSQGFSVAGLGASAKSTVWINACGFTKKDIAFVSDNTMNKQYCNIPGTDILVIDEGAILRELPDYVIMFAWNYRLELLEKFSLARSKGVKFIVPVPQIEVV